MEAIIISDKAVTFQEFVSELSDVIAHKLAKQMSSNRTFMELKFQYSAT